MDEGFAEIWVITGDVPSLELCERAPVAPIDGWCMLRQRTPSTYPVSHLHFGPGVAETAPLGEQIERVVELVERHRRQFSRYRRLTPFYLQAGWHFREALDVTVSSRVTRMLARLRAPFDLDLYWTEDDGYVERVRHTQPFYYGDARVSVAGRLVRDGIDAAHDLGRLVPAAARLAEPGDEIEIDVQGGCGSPTAHFSAYGLRVAAANDSPVRLRVQPNIESRAPRLPRE